MGAILFHCPKNHKPSSAKPFGRGWHARRPVARQAKSAILFEHGQSIRLLLPRFESGPKISQDAELLGAPVGLYDGRRRV